MRSRLHSLVIVSLAAVVTFACTAPTLGGAREAQAADESLADKKFWTDQAALIKDNVDTANSRCGAHFTFDWVNKDDLKTKTAAEHSSPFGTCLTALDTLGSICGKGDDEKKTVVKKVSGVQCGYGKPHHVAITSGKLDARLNVSEANLGDQVTNELMHLL
jgi:hypothetical protein